MIMILILWRLFWIAIGFVLATVCAAAQDESSGLQVRKGEFPAVWSDVIEPDSFMPTLASLVARYEREVGGPCQQRFTIDADITRPALDKFSQSLRRAIGADSVWKLKVFLEKCGREKFDGLAFNFENDSKIQIALLAPGRSLADPVLVRDTAVAIYTNVHVIISEREDCPAAKEQPLVFFDREVTDRPQLGRQKPGWTERWAVPLCGDSLIFKINYQINDAGASYHIIEDGISEPKLFSVSKN